MSFRLLFMNSSIDESDRTILMSIATRGGEINLNNINSAHYLLSTIYKHYFAQKQHSYVNWISKINDFLIKISKCD